MTKLMNKVKNKGLALIVSAWHPTTLEQPTKSAVNTFLLDLKMSYVDLKWNHDVMIDVRANRASSSHVGN